MGILSKIGIEVAPKQPTNQPTPDAPQVGVSPSAPNPDIVSTAPPSENTSSGVNGTAGSISSSMPESVSGILGQEKTPPPPASLLDPVPQQPVQPAGNTSSLENTSRPLDTLTPPPTPHIVPEEPRISTTVDQAPQDTVSAPPEAVSSPQPEPEIVAAPPAPEPPVQPAPQVVTTVTSPEPVSIGQEGAPAVSSSENQDENNASQNKEQEVKEPINFLERYLLKHHLKNYVKESGEIDEEALSHDAQSPDKLQEIDPRVANLVKGLIDRGLSLDDPLIAAGVEEVYMEDQKKAAV